MHLTPKQRSDVVTTYYSIARERSVNRAKVAVALLARQNIEISESGVKYIIRKWRLTSKVGDKPRPNQQKNLISNAGYLAINKLLLKRPFLTAQKVKNNLNLVTSRRGVARAIQKLGLRQVPTKYCQIVEPRNQIKRFIYCCLPLLR